jgi:hypothetical protein
MISKSLTFALLLGLAAACGDDNPIQSIDRSTDCSDICGKYKDCVGGSDFDTDKCSDDCSDMKSDEQSSKIDTCENCLDDKSCTEGAFNCLTECAGIVP